MVTWEEWGIFVSACYAVGGWRNLYLMDSIFCVWPRGRNIQDCFAMRDAPDIALIEYSLQREAI